MTTVIEPTLFDAPHAEPVDQQTASLLALIDGDPLHATDRARVLAAILETAAEHDGRVMPNELRALLHNEQGSTVYPPVIGATVNALKRAGRLVFEHEWQVTEGSTTGNDGKPARVYHWRP